jgi:predicted 3-demethylubiquinone-9 3-methyltransferase (glyoxalase superfamily)
MGSITPHLWFDTEAVEAADFYASTLPNSKVTNVATIRTGLGATPNPTREPDTRGRTRYTTSPRRM